MKNIILLKKIRQKIKKKYSLGSWIQIPDNTIAEFEQVMTKKDGTFQHFLQADHAPSSRVAVTQPIIISLG